MKVPFILSSYGYKAVANTTEGGIKLETTRGHPFYPVTLAPDEKPSDGDQVLKMLLAAFEAGQIDRKPDTTTPKRSLF
jgi:hypothetical protein